MSTFTICSQNTALQLVKNYNSKFVGFVFPTNFHISIQINPRFPQAYLSRFIDILKMSQSCKISKTSLHHVQIPPLIFSNPKLNPLGGKTTKNIKSSIRCVQNRLCLYPIPLNFTYLSSLSLSFSPSNIQNTNGQIRSLRSDTGSSQPHPPQ